MRLITNAERFRDPDTIPETAYSEALKALKALIETQGLNVIQVIAEATSDLFEKKLIEARGYELSKGVHSVWQLLGQRNLTGREQPFPGEDHSAVYTKNGKPEMFITQPYDLCWEEIAAAVDFCREHGLRMNIKALSWHYPCGTVLVQVTRDED